jgi:hypothetical protein
MLGKYEFAVPEKESDDQPEFEATIKVSTPADKYLSEFLRVKIVDRSPEGENDINMNEANKQ